jgi:hypothetical protein
MTLRPDEEHDGVLATRTTWVFVRLRMKEVFGLSGAEHSPRRLGRVPQDQRTAVGGQCSPRLNQHSEAGRIHELHLGEVKDELLLRAKVGFDRVSQPFAGCHVDLTANMDDCPVPRLRHFGQEVVSHWSRR